VPRISDHNPRGDEHLVVKIEFHLDPELPPHERLSSEMWAVAEPVHANVPLIPFQVGLKLMTLVRPPVGIDIGREDSIPRQIYDIDVLLALTVVPDNWTDLAAYGRHRFERESAQRGLASAPGQPWNDVIDRLDEWSACHEKNTRYWSLINAMQSSQLKRQSHRLPEEWAGRCRRLGVAMRCLERADPHSHWNRIIEIERRIPTNPQGPCGRDRRRPRWLTTRTADRPRAERRAGGGGRGGGAGRAGLAAIRGRAGASRLSWQVPDNATSFEVRAHHVSNERRGATCQSVMNISRVAEEGRRSRWMRLVPARLVSGWSCADAANDVGSRRATSPRSSASRRSI
jgi:hypothetical protein